MVCPRSRWVLIASMIRVASMGTRSTELSASQPRYSAHPLALRSSGRSHSPGKSSSSNRIFDRPTPMSRRNSTRSWVEDRVAALNSSDSKHARSSSRLSLILASVGPSPAVRDTGVPASRSWAWDNRAVTKEVLPTRDGPINAIRNWKLAIYRSPSRLAVCCCAWFRAWRSLATATDRTFMPANTSGQMLSRYTRASSWNSDS